MKIEKPKHDHKLTDLLKVCVFSLLMLAPLFASCSQWIYVTINKNAKDSYYGETINEAQIKETNIYNLQLNNLYYFSYSNETVSFTETNAVMFLNVDIFNIDSQYYSVGGADFDILETNYIRFANTTSYFVIQFYQTLDNQYYYVTSAFNTINFQFMLQTKPNIQQNYLGDYFGNAFTYKTYNKYSYLDNAFYYGVEQMTKSELFNWTQNTALYSGIKAMTDNLQIQTNAIAILLTYWFILTIIYIIVDIVLKLFTTITHLGTKD